MSGEKAWRVLVPGQDVTRWPEMKIARAVEGLTGLRARIGSWDAAGGAIALPTLSADGTRIHLALKVPSAPPVDSWAMELGESIHQLRAALDALAWDVAHLDGGAPKDPRNIYFPVIDSPDKWSKVASGALASIPSWVLQRMESVQPFRHTDGSTSFLERLHSLDIADKHRGLLTGKVRFDGIQFDGMGYEAPHYSSEDLSRIKVDLRPDLVEIEDGMVIGSIVLPKPLELGAVIRGQPKVVVGFSVIHRSNELPLAAIIDQFPGLTTDVMRRVYGTGD